MENTNQKQKKKKIMIKSNYSIKKKKKLMAEILSVGIQTRQTLSIIAMSVKKL